MSNVDPAQHHCSRPGLFFRIEILWGQGPGLRTKFSFFSPPKARGQDKHTTEAPLKTREKKE
jgi:hypothetical protein